MGRVSAWCVLPTIPGPYAVSVAFAHRHHPPPVLSIEMLSLVVTIVDIIGLPAVPTHTCCSLGMKTSRVPHTSKLPQRGRV